MRGVVYNYNHHPVTYCTAHPSPPSLRLAIYLLPPSLRPSPCKMSEPTKWLGWPAGVRPVQDVRADQCKMSDRDPNLSADRRLVGAKAFYTEIATVYQLRYPIHQCINFLEVEATYLTRARIIRNPAG